MYRFTTRRIAALALLAILFPAAAYAETSAEQKRAATIQEFARDPMLFITALVVELDVEVTSGTLTADQFHRFATDFFIAVNAARGTPAEKLAAIYDAAPAAQARLRAAARRIRAARSRAAQSEAALRREEEDVMNDGRPT